MFKHFISLQWKSFIRSASFRSGIWFKILMIFGAFSIVGYMLVLGFFAFKIIESLEIGDPLRVVNQYAIYYIAFDMVFRYMLQKMPVTNIRPLLYLPFKKSQIVHYSLGKTVVSFFNWTHAFFFIPFSIILIIKGYNLLGVIGWHLGFMALIYCNNFINVLVNNKDNLFYLIAGVFILLGVSQYYGWFDITTYTGPIFNYLYDIPATAIVPWTILLALFGSSFNYFKENMFLDGGLAIKTEEAKTEDLDWLNRFGNLATFLKNDIKLIKRNKRARSAVIAGCFFIFYGLLFFTGAVESYDNPFMKIFAGIFVTGGFLFSFGQFVPSWDSSYYPLMMSQNIQYHEYLRSKWYLVIIATVVSTILATFYLYFGWDAYLAVLVGAIYNIGVNSYLVLWGGAYVKTPIDLTSNKKAFGDKQSINAKTILIGLPKIVLPIVIYTIGHFIISPMAGYIFVALTGVLGFVFKNKVFAMIEKIYKKEKYKTLAAYKQKA